MKEEAKLKDMARFGLIAANYPYTDYLYDEVFHFWNFWDWAVPF